MRHNWPGMSREIKTDLQLLGTIIDESPVAMSIVRAPDFVYEAVNPAFQALAPGKPMLGRRFSEVWSEVQQPLVPILEHVIATGETFRAVDAPLLVQRQAHG